MAGRRHVVPGLLRLLGWGLVAALAVVAVLWWVARPATPDAFYAATGATPSRPGTLLKQEPFERGVPDGARGWRILYATTRADGAPAVASAVVVASRPPTSAPMPVIAWTHGTTGVASGCAPSLLDDPFANVPALKELLASGGIYVASDYVGLGSAGPHPYLIGEETARSVLDSIRASRQMKDVTVDPRTVVWGHSQGGHAALWTGILAPTYAPDVEIRGVAGIAPATNLRELIEAVQSTPIGRILSSYILSAYSAEYPDVSLEAYTACTKRIAAADLAGRCLAESGALFSAAQAMLMKGSLFGSPPGEGALGRHLEQNAPDRLLTQPLLVAQGLADQLVRPDIQARFVDRRCAAGQDLEYRTYPGLDHLSIVAADSPLTPDLMRWTQARLAGDAPLAGCRRTGSP
jgi:pimeloyl-ACP methyl ester carboxylesterase